MKMLHQHSDGTIWVRGNEGHYGEKPEVFEKDHGKKLPALPPGITERIYEPGVRHALNRGNNTVDGGPMPWPEGDAVIAKLNTLLQRQVAREEEAKQAIERKREETQKENERKLEELRRGNTKA